MLEIIKEINQMEEDLQNKLSATEFERINEYEYTYRLELIGIKLDDMNKLLIEIQKDQQ